MVTMLTTVAMATNIILTANSCCHGDKRVTIVIVYYLPIYHHHRHRNHQTYSQLSAEFLLTDLHSLPKFETI